MITALVLVASVLVPAQVNDPIDIDDLVQAQRLESVQWVLPPPPPPLSPELFTTESANGRCVGAEWSLGWFSPGWDVVRMSRIMYRESRCNPWADNSRSTATGLLQILSSHCRWLAAQMGEPCSAARLMDPGYNIRAGAVLWREQGYGAWSTA